MIIWLQQIGMAILLWLLGLIDSIFSVFSAAAGVSEVTTGNNGHTTLGAYFLQLDGVQRAFFIIIIVSVGICAICTIAAIIKSIVNMKSGEPKPHSRTVGQALGSIFVTLAMGTLLIVGIGVSDKLLAVVNREMNGGKETIMSHEIMNISVHAGYRVDTDNVQGLNEFDKDGNPTYRAYFYCYQSKNGENLTGYTGSSGHKWNEIIIKTKKCIQFKKNKVESDYLPKKFIDTPPDASESSVFIMWLDKETGQPYSSWNECYERAEIRNEDDTYDYHVKYDALTLMQFESGWLSDKGKNSLKQNIWNESATGYNSVFGTYSKTLGLFPDEWKQNGKVNPANFNFAIAYICAIVILVALIGATFGLVKRLFDLILLFIALPGICATIPLDDGAKFKIWRETVISKVFLAFGSVLAVNIFFIVAPSLWAVNIPGASSFTNSVLKLVLICGGALTISGGQLLFARLLGTSAEESREMGQSARTLWAGGAAITRGGRAVGRGLFGFRNANGQRVGGLIKGGAGVLGAIGGGAVNTAGNALGGQAYRNSRFGRGTAATQRALKGFSNSAGWFMNGNDQNPNLGYGLGQAKNAIGEARGGSSRNGALGAVGRAMRGRSRAMRGRSAAGRALNAYDDTASKLGSKSFDLSAMPVSTPKPGKGGKSATPAAKSAAKPLSGKGLKK